MKVKNTFLVDTFFKLITVESNGLAYHDVKPSDKVWQDYPPNAFALPIFSEKFKNSINEGLTGKEEIDWININVKHFDDQRIYYLLRFNKLYDVIDKQNTLYVKNTNQIIRPCFKEKVFNEIAISPKPQNHDLWKITSGLYVSENLMQIIKKAKIKGVEFSKCRST